LYEIDTRFSQLDESGIFATLQGRGVLNHHVAGVDNIEHAMAHPPRQGRARLRGECVRRFAGKPSAYVCEWSGVWDIERRRRLDLSDPFREQEHWESDVTPQRRNPRFAHFDLAMQRALQDYESGDFQAAAHWLDVCTHLHIPPRPTLPPEYLRYQAWTRARRGFVDGAAILDRIPRPAAVDLTTICDYLCVYRHQGLVPAPEMHEWIRRGTALDLEGADPSTEGTFRDHLGYALLCRGRVDDAITALEEAAFSERFRSVPIRTRARLLADLAEAYRRRGDPSEPLRLLEEASQLQSGCGYRADLAEVTYARRAKTLFETDPVAARTSLDEAKTIQTQLHHRMGEARTVLLEARMSSRGDAPFEPTRCHQRITELREQLPALQQCRLLKKIFRRWKLWISGEQPTGEPDFFWGL
jgi:hypothetical protein